MGWAEDLIPQDATIETEPGKMTPMRELPFVKETPDVLTLVKRTHDMHKEIGARVPVKIERVRNSDGTFGPKAEAVTKWRTEHLPKLYEQGILDAPPLDVAGYGITKPEGIPANLGWSDELQNEFATIGLKHGVPKAAMHAFVELHRKSILDVGAVLKASEEAGIAALKAEYGADYDSVMEDSKRLTDIIFKTPEEFEFFQKTNINNHPLFLSVIARLSKFAKQDSSMVEDLSGAGTRTGPASQAKQEALRAEMADIMTNPQNPLHEKYMRGDPDTHAAVEKKYEEAYGVKGTKEIGTTLNPRMA